jgi:hypothetical protein
VRLAKQKSASVALDAAAAAAVMPTGGETKNAAQAKDNSSADTLFMFQDRRHT